MIGQMTIDDFLCEEKPFSWDADINYIYEGLNQIAKRFNLATKKRNGRFGSTFHNTVIA